MGLTGGAADVETPPIPLSQWELSSVGWCACVVFGFHEPSALNVPLILPLPAVPSTGLSPGSRPASSLTHRVLLPSLSLQPHSAALRCSSEKGSWLPS